MARESLLPKPSTNVSESRTPTKRRASWCCGQCRIVVGSDNTAVGSGLPDSAAGVGAIYTTSRSQGVIAGDGVTVVRGDQVAGFLYEEGTTQATRLEVQVTTFTDDGIILEAREVLEDSAAILASDLGAAATTVSVSGEIMTQQDSLAAFTDSMLISLPIAILLTVLIVGFALGSVRYSVVTVIPILLVVAWVSDTCGSGVTRSSHQRNHRSDRCGCRNRLLDALHRALPRGIRKRAESLSRSQASRRRSRWCACALSNHVDRRIRCHGDRPNAIPVNWELGSIVAPHVITRRSQVQILPPLRKNPWHSYMCRAFSRACADVGVSSQMHFVQEPFSADRLASSVRVLTTAS